MNISEPRSVDLAVVLQLVGFGLLVGFAATFGYRWGMLAGGLVLLVLGMAASGVRLQVSTSAGMPVEDPRLHEVQQWT